eukprot:TRINITY_DN27759_c0_g1_i1.p1 TRINITY_DN27759_c0_g1~~TRINITY_DN27759_c0_g1_i1.p1  ORF type:complete len:164 (-),score=43.83 TRINITY_DN27759_c0_g1_i1:12-503(-)
MMEEKRVLLLSNQFVISCGTVCFDLEKNRVMLIYYKAKKEFFLPKGRKEVGEDLEETAKRETLEETGFECELVKHSLNTLATTESQEKSKHSEPIAVQQRFLDGVLKIIFWYVGKADSTAVPKTKTLSDEQQFETHWIPITSAEERLTYHDDREIFKAALSAL